MAIILPYASGHHGRKMRRFDGQFHRHWLSVRWVHLTQHPLAPGKFYSLSRGSGPCEARVVGPRGFPEMVEPIAGGGGQRPGHMDQRSMRRGEAVCALNEAKAQLSALMALLAGGLQPAPSPKIDR